MNKRLAILGAVLIVLGFIAAGSFYTVRETEQVLVLQFGEPVRVVQEPGLRLKLPLIQNVVYYEDRILNLDPPVEQVILADQRRLDVNSFARYRIINPLQFYQTVTSESGAQARLSTLINATLRRQLGNVTLLEVLSGDRARIIEQTRAAVNEEAERFGIRVLDVRIGRADVPEDTRQSIFDRMISEREREAAEFRAQGQEQAQQIRSRADRERTVLLAEAERDSQVIRGEGDREAIAIQAQAYSQDPEFFSFYRSLQAYRVALGEGTSMVLSPDSDFFRYFSTQAPTNVPADALPGLPALPAAQ
ncbi:MAG: protease modulator HflC [Inquilinaceae bacterium]